MSTPAPCPRCTHGSDQHWPAHGESTTACILCLSHQWATCDQSAEHRVGICCWPAEQIEREADDA